jgi:hypothetical protein
VLWFASHSLAFSLHCIVYLHIFANIGYQGSFTIIHTFPVTHVIFVSFRADINGIPNGCPKVFVFCPRYPGSGELGRQRPQRSHNKGNQNDDPKRGHTEPGPLELESKGVSCTVSREVPSIKMEQIRAL